MNRLLSLLLLTVFMQACNAPKPTEETVPTGLLTPTELRDLLVNMALSESVSNLNPKSAQPVKFDSVYAFNPLKEAGIRKSQYDSSLAYYSAHPALYRQVYDSVLTKLSAIRLQRQQITPKAPGQ